MNSEKTEQDHYLEEYKRTDDEIAEHFQRRRQAISEALKRGEHIGPITFDPTTGKPIPRQRRTLREVNEQNKQQDTSNESDNTAEKQL